MVPDECVLGIDRRLISGETGESVAAHLEALARSVSALPLTVHRIKSIHAFEQDPSTDWGYRLSGWSGQAPTTAPYCTNAWAYVPDVARQRVVIGPGSIDQAHGEEEWVEISELEKLAGIYARWWGVA